jgi:membrane protein YqaA with SNARE-associated domain
VRVDPIVVPSAIVVPAPHAGGLEGWLIGLGGPGLLLYAVADGSLVTLLPGGADVLTLLLAAAHPKAWPYYALMATAGSLLGGLLAYQVAAAAGAAWLAHRVGEARIARMRRHGWAGVLVGAILPAPFPYKLVPLAAGAARVPRAKFVPALAAGRGARFSLAAYVGARFGADMAGPLERGLATPGWIGALAAAVAAIAAGLWWLRRRGRRG